MGESHTLRDSEREITRLLEVFPAKFRRAAPYESLNSAWLSHAPSIRGLNSTNNPYLNNIANILWKPENAVTSKNTKQEEYLGC